MTSAVSKNRPKPATKTPRKRRQVAALCFRGPAKRREVLLVTSRGTGRWILPKGWPMKGKSDAEAARIEAWEEAGVKAKDVQDEPLGTFDYTKDQHKKSPIPTTTEVYAVEVKKLADDFPEAGERERRWVPVDKAVTLVEERGLKKLLKSF